MPRGSKIGLLGLGAYVPARVMTNDDWARRVDTSDAWIVQRTGIERRRIAAEDESTVDLASAAARRALEDAGLEVGAIREIVVATDTPEVRIPDTAAILQHRLGAPEVPAYDLGGSGCAGFVLGLDVASARVAWRGGPILLVGVEVLSRMMDWQDRNTCVLFGDAAGAAVVGELEDGTEDDHGVEILAVVAGTDGSRASILGLEAGGTRVPITLERVRARDHVRVDMDGPAVFKEAVARMGAASREVLERAGARLEDVALVVPHQANLRILRAVAKALGVSMERIFVNVDEYGNTGSASVPLALVQAREERRIARGDLVLLTSFGAGFHWAAALLRF